MASTAPLDDSKLRHAERRIRGIGYATVVLIFGGFGAWSALAPLGSAALAPGAITVENYRKTVQHLEGGIIKAIHVHDGDYVQRDQILVTLDSTQAKSQLEVLRGQLYITLAREARLIAQRDGLPAVNYPIELSSRRGVDNRIEDSIRVQDQTFRARKNAAEGEISLYQRQIEQLRAKVKGLRAQRQSREQLVASFRAELEDFRNLLKEGYTEKQKVLELERNLAQSEGQSGELTSEIAATELQISETELKILQLKKELQREVAKELSEVQSNLFELREKIQSLEDTVQRTEIKASDTGMVMGLSVHTLGGVIGPGGKLMEIVPENERLIVESRVSPLDIDRVHAGQTAEVRFSAFKSRDTPKVEGKVISISADSLVDEAKKEPEAYYLARVEIDEAGLRSLTAQHLELVPGMPAEVLINTGERTLLQYLTEPLLNTVARSLIED